MSSGLYGSNDLRLSSKAGAMEFSITINTTIDDKGQAVIDYRKAKRLFDFICKNVTLPEVPRGSTEALLEGYNELLGTMVKQLDKKEKGVAV